MQSPEILHTISEVAVVLAGFSGVVTALGRRASGGWSSAEILRLRTFVEPSLVVLFASMIPETLGLTSLSDVLVWRIASGTFGVLGLAGTAAYVWRSRDVRTTVGQRCLLVLTVPSIGALLLAAGGVLTQYELIFVLGLMLGLMVAAYNFLLLLFAVEDTF